MNRNLTETIKQFLGCPVRVFSKETRHEELLAAYDEALERGRQEGFVPVFVLAEELIWTAIKSFLEGPESDESLTFDPEAAKALRQRLLTHPLPDAHMVLAAREAMAAELDDEEEAEFFEEDNEDWQSTEREDGPGEELSVGRLPGLKQMRLQDARGSLLLAEIPVQSPWEVFAFVPFGGWNDVPSPEEVMAVSRHWYEHYRARPAVIGFDFLEFDLPEPVSPDHTEAVVKDHLAFAPEFFSMGVMDEKIMAQQLADMQSWFFWWD